MTIRRVRNIPVIHRMRMLSREQLSEHDTLARSLVREHRRTGDVTDRIDALGGGLHALVDLDESAIGDLNALLLETDVLDVGGTPGSDQNFFDFEVRLLSARVDCHAH